MIDILPVFDWFYGHGDIMLTIRTKAPGVEVPVDLRANEFVDFIIGVKPTPKLQYDKFSITAPMRFSQKLYKCVFPWQSIVRISSDKAVIQFTMSDESLSEKGGANKSVKVTQLPKEGKGTTRHLKVVK